MAIIISKLQTFICFLISSLFFLLCIASPATATEDPELQLCKKQCRLQARFEEWERRVCQYQCEEYAKQKAEREKEAPGQEEHDRQLEHCKHQCRSSQLSKEEREECRRRCEEHHREGWAEERDDERGEGREEKLEHCKHQCQSTEKDRHGQQQCRRECEEQYQEEREGKQMYLKKINVMK